MTTEEIKREEICLRGRLVPPVRALKCTSDKFFKIVDNAEFQLNTPQNIATEAAKLVADNAFAFWRTRLSVCGQTLEEADLPANAESYAIRINSDRVLILARTLSGVRYAMHTLRQLAESNHDTLLTNHYILPSVDIDDFPAMAFRGIHICCFPGPETPYVEIERQIRTAAYYKMNYAVIESWGALRFNSHPEFCWEKYAFSPCEFRRLVRLGKELGITLVPQLNIFGHASAARVCTAKHAILDLHPEFAPLFEPNGWCWCLSNPQTRKFLADIVEELFDIFDNPPYFHLGCDEASSAATCMRCRRTDYLKLLEEHLDFFRNLAMKRGARPLLWHDMFLDCADPRWNGYIRNGDKAYAQLGDRLSRDFIICDWQYDFPNENGKLKEPSWATTQDFIKRGFDTIACPWLNVAGLLSLGRFIEQHNGFGLLETTWHQNRGSNSMKQFYHGAWATWNPSSEDQHAPHMTYSAHVRDVAHDMRLTQYEDFGTSPYQTHSPFYEV